VLVACWSAKGGSGTTVVAAALASLLAHGRPTGAVLADLAGDGPAVLGRPDPPGAGLAEWLAAGASVPVDALARLEVEVSPRLTLLPRGQLDPDAAEPGGRGEVLAALLAADGRPVVADCGASPAGPRLAVAAAAGQSLLVLRPCAVALRRAVASPIRPSGVVLVDEPGRSITRRDVEDVLGVPVRAVVAQHQRIARAVDAGLLARRLPGVLERPLRRVA
jgi:MinD-like ATPase involved in chromosome partitioning or flagellar assembly